MVIHYRKHSYYPVTTLWQFEDVYGTYIYNPVTYKSSSVLHISQCCTFEVRFLCCENVYFSVSRNVNLIVNRTKMDTFTPRLIIYWEQCKPNFWILVWWCARHHRKQPDVFILKFTHHAVLLDTKKIPTSASYKLFCPMYSFYTRQNCFSYFEDTVLLVKWKYVF